MRTLLPGALLDERHALHARVVAGKAWRHVLQEAVVDLVDDLQVARQHRSNSVDRPRSSASGSSVWLV